MSSPETQPHGPDRPTLAPVAPPAQDPATASTVGAADAATPATPPPGPPPPGPTSPTLTIPGDVAPGRSLPVIPGYALVRRIGGGGMGEVYEATNRLGKRFALKLIRPDRTGDEFRIRFRKEAAALHDLDHPHVARIFDYSEVDGAPYFTMRLLTGGTLATRAAVLRADPRRAAELMAVVADAVAYLHGRKLLHRDLKPSNVLFDDEGRPFISDFGLVKDLAPGEEESPTTAADTAPDLSLTGTGLAMGTLRYMAPEQVRGDLNCVGPWSDVWALGVILYELLTGVLPFDDGDVAALKHRIQTEEPAPPRALHPALDLTLEGIVLKCLAKRPEDRYADAGQFADELRAWLNPPAQPAAVAPPEKKAAPSRYYLWIGAAALLVAVPVLSFWLRTDPEAAVRRSQEALARGESVAFLGETGPPIHHRIATGPGTLVWQHRDGTFTVDSPWFGLVEILPPPGIDEYRLRVWVRHNSWLPPKSRAGIYCLHAEHDVPAGRCHSFVLLSIEEDDLIEKEAEQGVKWADGERITSVTCLARVATETPDRNFDHRPYGTKLFRTREPANGQFQAWRELVLEVTPKEVRALHGNNRVGRVERARLEKHFRELLAHPEAGGPRPGTGRGGLGFYVSSGSASFRLGAVEPLGKSK